MQETTPRPVSQVSELRKRFQQTDSPSTPVNLNQTKCLVRPRLATPPAKPPRTFAHDIYLNQKKVTDKCVKSDNNRFLDWLDTGERYSVNQRRRSKSYENIYAEVKPVEPFVMPKRTPPATERKTPSIRSRVASDIDSLPLKGLFKNRETPSKQSRAHEMIKAPFQYIFRSRKKQPIIVDEKNESTVKDVEDRIIYVHTLKKNRSSPTSGDYHSSIADQKRDVSLCRCVLIIAKNRDTEIIPRNVRLNNLTLIEELSDCDCLDSDYYWFTIWTKDEKYLYCYCERQSRFRRRLCLVSDIYSPELYFRVFRSIETMRNIDESFVRFLKSNRFALPGDHLTFGSIQIPVPLDCKIDVKGQSELLYILEPVNIIKAISTLLLERRLVLVSKNPQRLLNSCRHMVTLLYPFSWDNMFWPLVPVNLCQMAATIKEPYLLGIRSSEINSFLSKIRIKNDRLLCIDLDKNSLLMSIGDEDKILPSKLFKASKMSLDLCLSMNDPEDKYRDAAVLSTFVEMFLQLIGTCKVHYIDGNFNREQFIQSQSSRAVQFFLQWFTETRLFNNFLRFLSLRAIQSSLHTKYAQFTCMGEFENKCLYFGRDSANNRSLFSRLHFKS